MTTSALFRPTHAKDHVGVSRATIYRWAQEGHIRLIKHGAMTFVRTQEVVDYIESLGDQLGDEKRLSA